MITVAIIVSVAAVCGWGVALDQSRRRQAAERRRLKAEGALIEEARADHVIAGHDEYLPTVPRVDVPRRPALSKSEWQVFWTEFCAESFDSSRLDVVRIWAKQHTFSEVQQASIAQWLTFDSSRASARKIFGRG